MPTVPLRSKRRERAQTVQKCQHAIPAAPLLFAGLQAIAGGAHGLELALAIFEIATSVLLLGTVVREIRALRRPAAPAAHAAHHGVDWVHIFAACVLVAEVLEHYHLTHHIRRPTVVTAIVTFALGLFHGRVHGFSARHNSIRVEDEGIRIGGKFFQAFRATWADIAAIDIGERQASIRTRDGRERTLNLADLHNVEHVRAALADAQSRAAAARTADG